MEIHHILPQEQGGQDTFENAIPLCFDCHSDAGHYFAKHPKGTRFSPQELKKHKETWFNIVKENKISIKEETYFHSRYCCPHLFYEMVDNRIVYKGEIFNTNPGDINSHSFLIGKNVISVVIAELEHEITVIKSIVLNDSEIMSNVILNTGDDLKIPVHENDRLEIIGYYTTSFENNFMLPIMQKHGLVTKYKYIFAQQSLPENAS